jgi:hypothetical protein
LRALGIMPRSSSNAIARIDAGVGARQHRAQVCAPVGLRRAGRLGQCQAVRISARKAAKIGAVAVPAFSGYGPDPLASRREPRTGEMKWCIPPIKFCDAKKGPIESILPRNTFCPEW